MIEKRIIFPATMFMMAGLSFAYGTWQFFHARAVQASADARLAHVVTTIEESDVSRSQKQQMYSTIMAELPPAPFAWGFDFSGSFASRDPEDNCTSVGQRSVCRTLKSEGTAESTYTAVCGTCDPQ